MTRKNMHIGLDDTDSTRMGCTTYIAALLVEHLKRINADFIDYPNLIRLNPNVPWKTRGNGALCLRVDCDEDNREVMKEMVISAVEENADMDFRGTDPGVVFLERADIPKEIQAFSKQAVTGIVRLKDALNLLSKYGGEAVGFKNGRGIIGALAAIGETLRGDHTYEILAYRTRQNYGQKRKVYEATIREMDRLTAPYTFNNVDVERGRVIITPRGPDPILFGIRGETPEIVKKAFEMVKPLEPVERWVVFRTNQGTDAHLRRARTLSQAEPYRSVVATGIVASTPRMIRGKHVFFPIRDDGAQVDCAAYEPTGVLRKIAKKLMVGDHVVAYGAVRLRSPKMPLTINLEKIRLLKLSPRIAYHNPGCPECGRRMKSMGRNKGFRCEKCRLRESNADKIPVRMKREVKRGLYVTSTRSQRHLTKPITRYGMEKRHGQREEMIENWHFP
jgi:tRNA(Ile2)-agmatinylcytidine synthase